ncbi:MAG TPA: hypothetical protein EYQ31_01065 [Candidatus Handelsmanbacteria bacterium]|nr:hypothetical protein [Candidatus Handelsmanbacteria bacterium]
MRDVLLTQDEVHGPTTLTLGVSESILSSWGAGVLRLARDAVTGVHLDIHTHRSPIVVDRVRAGEYMLACAPALPVRQQTSRCSRSLRRGWS